MKKITIIFFAFISIVFCGLSFKIAADFTQTLKITREDAEHSVYSSFSGGYLNYPYSVVYHSLASSTRTALVNEIGEFAKAYTRSEAFKSQYLKERNSIKPVPPEAPKSMAEMKNEYRESFQESIRNAESGLSNYSGEMRKNMEDMINSLKEQLKQVDDPGNPMFSSETEAAMKEGYNQQMEDFKNSVKEWEESYPESTDWMIKDRLVYFLDLSATVDFTAKLQKSEYGQWIFVKPDYEDMPSDWKIIFRAGRESTEAARVFATQWLSELK